MVSKKLKRKASSKKPVRKTPTIKKNPSKKVAARTTKKVTVRKVGKVVSKKVTTTMRGGKRIKVPKRSIKKSGSARRKKGSLEFLKNPTYDLFLRNLVGEEGMDVVRRVAEREVSDVDLAESMDLKPNIIRKHLYAMYEAGIVTYRRHRSKTGWYTYYWTIHPEKMDTMLFEGKDAQIEALKELITSEQTNHFYECENKCERAAFNEAMEKEFRCPRCEESMGYIDNQKKIAELQGRLAQLKSNVTPLDIE